ncbi:MAG: DUF433 domain-containing protein [Acidimicrobiia bacterium]|nr:DUF433 domain-containing protein [Acidimicrobiia bacterium]MBJ7382076.1 DUF433 domain-containing protein [Acidimicrobiia bacterium]
MHFERISLDHNIMGGVPCVRGTRIPVTTVVGMVAESMNFDEIVADFPQLTPADIQDSLRYAAAAVDERQLPLSESA